MKNKGDLKSSIIIYVILGVFTLIMAYPLLYVISCSFSDPAEVYAGNVILFPKGLSFASYEKVFQNKNILTGYGNTIYYTLVGTIISMVLSFTAAYPLSRKDMAGRGFFMTIFVITMFFSGGLIPLYLVVNNLNLIDTIWGFILPGCLGVWNVIVIRTYISSSIPYELQESAMMDGAGGFTLFFRIIIPLCKPILAVMMLFYIVGYWNSYFNALIFISDEQKFPLQMILRNILIEQDISKMVGGGGGGSQETLFQQAMLSESIKYSSIIVSTVPILCIYPFIAKYFEKGLLVGSLKG
jgi:putative aldouronate transport system permease protein